MPQRPLLRAFEVWNKEVTFKIFEYESRVNLFRQRNAPLSLAVTVFLFLHCAFAFSSRRVALGRIGDVFRTLRDL